MARRHRQNAWNDKTAKEHWAFQAIKNPAVPTPADLAKFIQNPIDAFVLAKLTEKKLAPSAPADKATLLRRVTYDLTGLPPTAAEMDAFLADASPSAYEKAIDRLLASPAYGERWGRHWLDVARYADTNGDRLNGKRQPLFAYAWTYRDYVINAFNADLPYDQFVREQIAADRLPERKRTNRNWPRSVSSPWASGSWASRTTSSTIASTSCRKACWASPWPARAATTTSSIPSPRRITTRCTASSAARRSRPRSRSSRR